MSWIESSNVLTPIIAVSVFTPSSFGRELLFVGLDALKGVNEEDEE